MKKEMFKMLISFKRMPFKLIRMGEAKQNYIVPQGKR